MPRNLDTALLRAFVAVSDAGGMTAAAGALNLTQAAVSQQIKRLEETFDLRLFDRDRRGLVPTPAGERLLPLAKRMLAANDAVVAEMTEPLGAGEVRLGIPYDLVPGIMPLVLKRFAQRYPRMRLQLTCVTSQAVATAVARGEVDLGLVEELETLPHGETIMVDALVWVGAAGGEAWSERPLPVTIGSETCSFRGPIVAALDASGIPWRKVGEISNVEAHEATVLSDLAVSARLSTTLPPGLALLPREYGLPALPEMRVSLYRRPGLDLRAADVLAEMIRDAFRQRLPRVAA